MAEKIKCCRSVTLFARAVKTSRPLPWSGLAAAVPEGRVAKEQTLGTFVTSETSKQDCAMSHCRWSPTRSMPGWDASPETVRQLSQCEPPRRRGHPVGLLSTKPCHTSRIESLPATDRKPVPTGPLSHQRPRPHARGDGFKDPLG